MLRSGAFTHGLNAIEERAGDVVLYTRRDLRVSDLADFLFHSADLKDEFAWTSRIAGAEFVVPVDPSFPRPSPGNDPWGPATYWHRAANRKTRDFYERYLARRRAGTFVDVGANWGMHVYPFAASGYRCIAFEPQTICCQFIRRVAALNKFPSVEVVPSGVGAAACAAVPFFESAVEAFSSMNERHVASFNRPFEPRTIEVVTLDGYCAAHQVAPTFLKIDTEGYEWQVLQGAAQMVREFKPGILVEVSTSADDQRAMWDMLAGLGYRCYAIDRSLRARYPKRPFEAVRDVNRFLAREVNPEEPYNDADFVFLQLGEDVLAF